MGCFRYPRGRYSKRRRRDALTLSEELSEELPSAAEALIMFDCICGTAKAEPFQDSAPASER